MKKWFTVFLLLLAVPEVRAQLSSFGDVPIEITSDNKQFDNGVATAEGNVVIQYKTTTLYCDYAQYSPETREVLVRGDVRIYREPEIATTPPRGKPGRANGALVFVGERAIYNLESKQLRAAGFRGDFHPLHFDTDTFSSLGPNAFQARDGAFTTSDSSKPDYSIRARTVRIYPKDRIIFVNATLYLGQTPIFWWPYLYQSLKQDTGFTITPGYRSSWGVFLLSQTSFPIAENWAGRVHVDYRAERGLGLGLDSDFRYGKDDRSWGRFRSYYADDTSTSTNETGLGREPIDPDRYRVSLQHRVYITDDIYANIDLTKLSDRRVTEDFLPNEFRIDPQPDNLVSVTKWDNAYTATLIARGQINDFFDATERLPEFVFDIKRQAILNSPIFYEGETGVARLTRNFAKGSPFSDYDTTRLDSYHELSLPTVYHGWLSLIPRVGVRGTYYTDSGRINQDTTGTTLDTILPEDSGLRSADTSSGNSLEKGDGVFRGVAMAGFESSFKFSRAWDNVQSRTWGLEELRHVVQPYTDFSFVYSSHPADEILQFDRYQRSTQLPIFDFPEFTSTDAINDWAILRLGVRNRLQTKRDNNTLNWFELDTFIDVNAKRPDFPGTPEQEGTLSNLYNRARWSPLPWVSLSVDSQVPTSSDGFTQVNTGLSFLVNSNVRLDLGHRYISDNPFFIDSSLVSLGGYLRLGDNWGFSAREDYEADDGTLESQTYQLHRDLSSWVASLGFVVRDNRGTQEIGVLLSFTLKDMPSISLPFSFDPEGLEGSSKSK